MENWTEQEINKVFNAFLDEMETHKANEVRKICVTTNDKRTYLIEQEKKFVDSFK